MIRKIRGQNLLRFPDPRSDFVCIDFSTSHRVQLVVPLCFNFRFSFVVQPMYTNVELYQERIPQQLSSLLLPEIQATAAAGHGPLPSSTRRRR
jgi:hypothetical protein